VNKRAVACLCDHELANDIYKNLSLSQCLSDYSHYPREADGLL